MMIAGYAVSWWEQFIVVCLVITGAGTVVMLVMTGLRHLWEWARRDRVTLLLERRDSADPPWWWKPWLSDRVEAEDDLEEPLPPERTWEQMTSHALAAVAIYDAARQDMNVGPLETSLWHDVARERRPLAYEMEARAHYVAMGFEYPSGLMERVRELTP